MSHPSSDTLLAVSQLAQLRAGFNQLSQQQITAAALGDLARSSGALLTVLPPRYAEVLLQLLDRMEASALFTEESCSFSPNDMHESLQAWGAKAHERLELLLRNESE